MSNLTFRAYWNRPHARTMTIESMMVCVIS
jgi:hypothetical protein